MLFIFALTLASNRMINCLTRFPFSCRKSKENPSENEKMAKDCDDINNDVLSALMTSETSSVALEDKQRRDDSLNNITEKKRISVGLNVNVEKNAVESVTEKPQLDAASNINGNEKAVEENPTSVHLYDPNPDDENGRLDEKIPENGSKTEPCPHGKEKFIHQVDLDLSPINDCEVCQEHSVVFANSSVVRPEEDIAALPRSIFASDSYNSAWDNLYKNLESDCYSEHLNGCSRSATQSFDLQEPHLSMALLQADNTYMTTPLSNIGPFVSNSTPYSPAPMTENQLSNIIEGTPTKFGAPKKECSFLSAIIARDDAKNVTPNKVRVLYFYFVRNRFSVYHMHAV